MLNMQNVVVEYDGTVILDEFNLSMNVGEVVCLVGESGSGKTTVIRSVLGLLSATGAVTGGDIIFEEESLVNASEKELQKLRGRKIAMIFQNSAAMLNPIRTIGSQFVEYLCFHKRFKKKDAWEYAVKMLEMVQLKDARGIMKRYPFQLSGGMCQRVGIAMAMSFKPKLLLADEPTSALDGTTQAEIVRQMMQMHDEYKMGILMVTHNLGIAAHMADKIIVMKNGRIVECGSREQILNHSESEYTKKLLAAVETLDGERYVG